jgi:hypothetical protein
MSSGYQQALMHIMICVCMESAKDLAFDRRSQLGLPDRRRQLYQFFHVA